MVIIVRVRVRVALAGLGSGLRRACSMNGEGAQ